jgi:CO/xanthine dehydrogenase Mo-binding subunit
VTTTQQLPKQTSVVGGSQPRLDANLKLLGRAAYGADIRLPDMLHGRPVLSLHAHARIVGIDATAALRVPGVHAVLTAADLPIRNQGSRSSEPLARREVVFAGQPVALVVAETEAAAQDGVDAVVVDYEPLPAVLDVERAVAFDAPPVRALAVGAEDSDVEMHGDVGPQTQVAEQELPPNVTGVHTLEHGELDAAFAACAAVVARRYRTAWVHQATLEPQVAVAWPDGDGGLGVRTSTQGVFLVRQVLARVLELPLTKIRVEASAVGGAFGSKIGLLEPLVASAALAVGRPLRVAFTRREDFSAANPAPGIVVDLRVGARADGSGLVLEGSLILDSGAFADSSPAALAGGRLGGAYRWDAWHVEVTGVRTNRFGAGAYRAPTAPQTAFALESAIDELAQTLGIDPLELRLKNAAERGDIRFDGSLWPQLGMRDTLLAAAEHPLWQRRHELPDNEGVGLAAGLFPGNKMGATAICRMDGDGGVTVVHGYVDLTGSDTSMAAIAAETIGLPIDSVRVVAEDSSGGPHGGVTGGSMVTYCLGPAVRDAAEDARRQILRIAAAELEADEGDLEIVDGTVELAGRADAGIALSQVAARATGFGTPYPPVQGHGVGIPPELAPSSGVALAHARVDHDTGHVKVLEYVAIQDVGRAINRGLCEGQMRGGAAQAIGFALFEQLVHDEEGQLLTPSFMQYSLPRSHTTPPIETVIIEVPSPHGPLGAKGIGETAIVPGAPAIANAVAAATGRRLTELPLTPERVWRALAKDPG